MYAYVQHINFSQSDSLHVIVKIFQWIQAVCNEVQIFNIILQKTATDKGF